MGYLPEIPVWATTPLNTTTFLGLNRGLSIADGEMEDMLNMCGDHYPVLSTRRPRSKAIFPVEGGGQAVYPEGISGMLGTDRLIVCSGEKVYMDGVEIPLTVSAEEHMQPKQLVAMGAYVTIWPDKKYFNVTNLQDSGEMGSRWTVEEDGVISAMMCRKDGTDYDMESITISDMAPAEPVDQQLWLDTSGETDVLKQYSGIYLEWIQVATTYIKLQATGIGKGLKESDVVHLSGVKAAEEEQPAAEGGEETLSFPMEDFYLYSSFTTTKQGGAGWSEYVSTTATIAEQTKTIKVEGIPEGATVSKAVLKMQVTGSMYGAKLLTCNGVKIYEGAEAEVPVDVTGDGEYSFKFRFQSKNTASSAGTHGGTVNFRDISLQVTYGASGADVTDADAKELERLNTTNIIYGCGDDYIIVAGLLHKALTLSGSLAVELKIPDLDYICESNNRLWGCSYSTIDGQLTNEIRCCALGDFRNWYKFEGTSQDSYVMSVGSDGVFTGAISLQGVPLFWKEDYLHRISGTMPSNYTLNTLECRGVQEGSWRSLAVVNETLYYKARNDVMAYDGAQPYSVSEKLGRDRYWEAVGGAYRDKYYINMRVKQVKWHLYVFDTAKSLWHKEDEVSMRHMAAADGDLYLTIETEDGTVIQSVDNPENEKEDFAWSVTFGTFGFAVEEQKYLSRFNIRAQMAKGGMMKLEIMYDSDGKWVNHGVVRCPALRTFTLPVIPRRCDHCQVRLSGTGTISIYSLARIFETGGDVQGGQY